MLLFLLASCARNEEDSKILVEKSIPETFKQINLEEYNFIKGEKLTVNNSPSDYEYDVFSPIEAVHTYINSIVSLLDNQEHSNDVIYGERPEVILYYENEDSTLEVSFYIDSLTNDSFRCISIMTTTDDSTDSIILEKDFTTEIQQIYNLIKN